MKRSYLIACVLALAAACCVVSGQVGQDRGPKAARKPPADPTAPQTVPPARVGRLPPPPRSAALIPRGGTQAPYRVVGVLGGARGVPDGTGRREGAFAGGPRVALAWPGLAV